MSNLQVIERNGMRVLTSTQLAESYGTNPDRIAKNFSENKSRYKEGKHYIKLDGEQLKEFKNDFRNSELVHKQASSLYLWTEKGAWLHAKSLNTDQAWDAYEMLVDDYYSIKQQPKTQAEIIAMLAQYNVEQERRLTNVEKRIEVTEQKQENITEILSLNPTEWRKKVNVLINKIAQANGDSYQDIRNESYKRLEERARCQLSIRLTNRKRAMALEGAAKSKLDKVNKMDVIADDARLTEIYLAIVKEMAIQHRVEVPANLVSA